VALDIQELESSFCKEKKKDAAGDNEAEAKRKTAAAAAAAKPKEINLLDPKTLQNVGILLAKLRMPATEIKEAVLAMDQHKLGLENVMALRALAPTSDDISTLREFEGDASTLGKVEKFFLEITDIARYTQRLDCWIYKLKFDGTFEGMDATIRVVVEATHALSSSMQFKRLLEVVLALGNYLNGGTARGGLYGFKLDALLKLATIKSVDNTQSLMNYLVAWCEKNAPELLELATSLEVMEVGCRVSLQQWMADFNSVESSFKMLEKQV
jgi:diaphanous 1